jgi:histone-lysine N-methyltransferase SETD1
MDYFRLIGKFLLFIFSYSAGEIVIEYVGELITNKIADFREKEYNFRGFGDCYMFRLDQNLIVFI